MIEQAAPIVLIETAANGDPVFVDERGRRWTSPRGRSEWREVEPVEPSLRSPPSHAGSVREAAAGKVDSSPPGRRLFPRRGKAG
jgi:hypothetical protein